MPIKDELNFLIHYKLRKRNILGKDRRISLYKVKMNLIQGNYQDVLDELPKIKRDSMSIYDQLRFEIVKCECLLKLSLMKRHSPIREKLLESFKEHQTNDLLLIDAIIILGETMRRLGRIEECISILEKFESILSRLANKLKNEAKNELYVREAALSYQIGAYSYYKGNYTKAFQKIETSILIRKRVEGKLVNHDSILFLRNQLEIGIGLNLLGVIRWYQGKLDFALDYYQSSLEYLEKIGNQLLTARTYNNIGDVHRSTGELDVALQFCSMALETFEKIDNTTDRINSIVNIGLIHYEKGDLDLTVHFIKKALQISIKIGNNLTLSELYFYLISISLDKKEMDEAKQFIGWLKYLAQQEPDNRRIDHRYQVAQGLILKSSSRIRDKAKAQEIFEGVIEDEVVEHEMTTYALLNMCELLLSELRSSGEEAVLNEVKLHVQHLSELAEEKHSYSLLAKTAWLQSQLALIELRIEDAKSLLTKAQLIAEEKNLKRLAITISKEHDKLLDQIKIWEEFGKRNASMSERVSTVRLENQLIRMIKHSYIENVDIVNEVPVYFAILTTGGISLYSKTFMVNFSIDNILVGGFLTAIQDFGTKIFYQSLDRVRIGDYTLLFDFIDDIRLCYVFIGDSYPAIQKLNQFKQIIGSNTQIMDYVNQNCVHGAVLLGDERKLLDQYLSENFLTSSIKNPVEI